MRSIEKKMEAISVGGQIIFLPEMFTTGFSMHPENLAEDMQGQTMNWMETMAVEKRSIIVGSFIAREAGNFYNRLVWMLPNGSYGYYDKRHLFAYAGENAKYSPGNKRLIAAVNGWRLNLTVCYDLRFPVWMRQQFEDEGDFEYDVLVCIANWPEMRSQAWKTLLQARAIENQCYVIGVNRVGTDGNDIYYSGDSMVIDPLGEVLFHKEHEEGIYTMHLDREHLETCRKRFPFGKDADGFVIKA